MSARSLIRKVKQLVGLSDGTGSEAETPSHETEETDVTVEREPESAATNAETGTTTPTDEETEAEPPEEPAAETGESVEKIKGIGPTYRDRLEASGLGTVPELAESDAETVAEVAQTSEGRAAEWIRRAKNR